MVKNRIKKMKRIILWTLFKKLSYKNKKRLILYQISRKYNIKNNVFIKFLINFENLIILILNYIQGKAVIKSLLTYYIRKNVTFSYEIILLYLAVVLKILVLYICLFPPLVYLRVICYFIMALSGGEEQQSVPTYLKSVTSWFYDPMIAIYKKVFIKDDFPSKIFVLITVGHVSKIIQKLLFKKHIQLLKCKL